MNATSMSIVLEVDWTPEGYLTEEQIVDQRIRIADAQAEVIQQVRLRDADAVFNRFAYIPVVAISVSEAALSALDSATSARRVEIAPAVPPLLSTTTVRSEATKLWSRGADGSGQVVAVLDTGVTTAHSALNGKVIGEACFSTHEPSNDKYSLCFGGGTSTTQSTASGSAVDCGSFASSCGHGTIMAGTIAADSAQKKGMAPGAKIYSVTTTTKIDGAALHERDDIALGLEHIYSVRNSFNFAAVLISAGSVTPYSSPCNSEHSDTTMAAANLKSVGIIPVAGSGNSGNSSAVSWPGCITHVVSVGAVENATDTIVTGSNRASFMDFWAPGHGATSTGQDGSDAGTCCTSAASAVMAGAFAVLRSGFPGTPNADTLINSAKSAGVVLGGAGLNKPRIALDLAMPPTPLNVMSWFCYGETTVSWPALDTANWYVLERAPLGTSNWQTAYQGSGTSSFQNVPETSVFRVQACDSGRCGSFNEVSGIAIRYGYCH